MCLSVDEARSRLQWSGPLKHPRVQLDQSGRARGSDAVCNGTVVEQRWRNLTIMSGADAMTAGLYGKVKSLHYK